MVYRQTRPLQTTRQTSQPEELRGRGPAPEALSERVETYYAEDWSLDELRRKLNSFGTLSLRRILGYRWHDYMSNDIVLREADLRHVTCIVRERQLRLYGHVARLPTEDPAHWILSCRDPRGWTMPRGRP